MKFYILLFSFITSQCVAQVFQSHPTASAINQFNFKFNSLFETSEDYVYSPFSISTALSMLYTGSTGQTKKEFVELFNFPYDINECTDNFATLLNLTNSTSFNSINSFWPDSNRVQMLKPYLANLKEGYEIELNYLNFNKIAESVDQINKWAETNTNGLIKETVKKDNINADLIFIFSNASYFEGVWEKPFDKELTYEDIFHSSSKGDLPVQYMKKNINAIIIERDNAMFYLIPYKGRENYFIICQPKHENFDLSKEFNTIDFTKLLFDKTVSFQEISLHLPRFRMSFSKEISTELKSLGLNNVYEGGLEKTGVAKRGTISLSFLNHDAVIKVEEKGTKAAAVTSGGAVSRGAPRIPETVKFDNPFYFSIINTNTTAILFWGKISNPENWKD